VSAPLCASVPDAAPPWLAQHRSTASDVTTIKRVLAAYTASVTNGDKGTFESLLLNLDITFTSTDELAAQDAAHVDTRRYRQFRRAVFETGDRFVQRFYNVHIQQDGDLAQVSLDFITKTPKSDDGGYGWKLLQLVKVQGQWKIASEIYTVRELPKSH
jgi:hypothetical protein